MKTPSRWQLDQNENGISARKEGTKAKARTTQRWMPLTKAVIDDENSVLNKNLMRGWQMVMSLLENALLTTRDEHSDDNQPAMIRVRCPLRAGCPNYGGIKRKKEKRRCYGRLFDLADNNGVVWLRFRCQQKKQVMVIRQMGSQILYWDEDDGQYDPHIGLPPEFTPIRCPVCGQWILDVYHEAGTFLLEFKCPTHKAIVSWSNASPGSRTENDCA